jgi:hypothetical protein
MYKEHFYQCQVLDNQDPLMLGRIRGRRLTDNYEDVVKSITDPVWNEERDPWTERDPFIFMPLMPYYLYSVPKPDEMCLIIYMSPDDKFVNQFYIQSTFYSPTSTSFQYYEGGNKGLGTGIQIANPKPLKNQDGTYTDKEIHKGVFPEPGDNSLLGRGNADVIVKENEILIRAGKFQGKTLQPNVVPVANQQRGFLQLSKFDSIKKETGGKTILELIPEIVLTKYLIEYNILNPENEQDKFTGSVALYQLKPDITINSSNINVNSEISQTLKTLVTSEDFMALSKIETINYINNFIKNCNDKNVSKKGVKLFLGNEKFPIYYRPSSNFYSKLIGEPNIEQKNLSEIFKGIKLNPAIAGGYGLIYTKNKVGTPTNPKSTKIKEIKYVPKPGTYGALGSDKIFLLSHITAIPGKGKINFDDTLYGISQEKFADEIIPKTSSLVRGEELLELINLIVRFLVTHTHAYPGLPPVPVTQDGTNSADILNELQNAVNKILNTNIRLN